MRLFYNIFIYKYENKLSKETTAEQNNEHDGKVSYHIGHREITLKQTIQIKIKVKRLGNFDWISE